MDKRLNGWKDEWMDGRNGADVMGRTDRQSDRANRQADRLDGFSLPDFSRIPALPHRGLAAYTCQNT